jgi:hypothetical protein
MSSTTDMKSYQVIDDSTQKAWANPKGMAELILHGVHDQTTKDYPDNDHQSHTSGGVPETTHGIIEEESDAVTKGEVEQSLEKPIPKVRVPSTLPSVSGNIPPTVSTVIKDKEITLKPDNEGNHLDDDTHEELMSEASEVASLSVQVTEIANVVNTLSRDLTTAMSRMESRISLLESRFGMMSGALPVAQHRRVVSGQLSPPLPIIPTAITQILDQPGASDSPHPGEELLDQCRSHRFTPSVLAQKQIILLLSEGKDISRLKFPIPKAQWKADYLYQIITSL